MSTPILDRYLRTRARTEALTTTLSAEDMQVQSMPDVSPTKWHLGHTTWFFETFVLEPRPGFSPVDERYRVIFNSYYEQVGAKHPRPERGLLTRPPLTEVLEYRQRVDASMSELLGAEPGERSPPANGSAADVMRAENIRVWFPVRRGVPHRSWRRRSNSESITRSSTRNCS